MKRRKKRTSNIITVVFAIAYFVTVFTMYNISRADAPLKYTEVFVDYNDTLWSIASENASDGTDLRRYVEQIKKFNNMHSSVLYANTVIKVPEYR